MGSAGSVQKRKQKEGEGATSLGQRDEGENTDTAAQPLTKKERKQREKELKQQAKKNKKKEKKHKRGGGGEDQQQQQQQQQQLQQQQQQQQQHQQQLQQSDENGEWAALVHARQDFPTAKKLMIELRQVGVNIKAISPLSKHKLKAEDACLVLALLSSSFLKTKQCMRSLQSALQCTVPWIPLVLDQEFSAAKVPWLRNALHRVTPHHFAVTDGSVGGAVNDQVFYGQLVKLLPLLSRYPVGSHIQQETSAEDAQTSDLAKVVGVTAQIQSSDENACERGLLGAIDMSFSPTDREHLHNAGAIKACFSVFDAHAGSARLIAFATYCLVALFSSSAEDVMQHSSAIARQCVTNFQRYSSSRDVVLQSLTLLLYVLDEPRARSAATLPATLPGTVCRLATTHVAEEGILCQAVFAIEQLLGASINTPAATAAIGDSVARLRDAIKGMYAPGSFPRELAGTRIPALAGP
ncbi:hypothetical protein PTSG_11397 [Salpingoeca rosetta]|uniref:TIR domain-containing protein n=1 Tax=Salpingoeca rosetta (strain ATCC 50818 / BSB-021) TaxID=946362 RepID=F2UTA3_SALR5|nr:uncharacterized protein PTSG_11397 [Salpingoeca rosetta]EGD81859.1 hypothetical protein PTSG_11397 [Salpingoeca rosetta]|eukprot:XP_004987600.1 hypothetical protein PTSG_11397 [Salpingoeca rosetta]